MYTYICILSCKSNKSNIKKHISYHKEINWESDFASAGAVTWIPFSLSQVWSTSLLLPDAPLSSWTFPITLPFSTLFLSLLLQFITSRGHSLESCSSLYSFIISWEKSDFKERDETIPCNLQGTLGRNKMINWNPQTCLEEYQEKHRNANNLLNTLSTEHGAGALRD